MLFRFENPMDRVVRFWAIIMTWAIDILKSDFIPSDFAISDYIGLHQKTDPFMTSKSKNLKLGIGSRKNQPYFDVTMCWYRVLMSYRSYRRARYRVLFYRTFRSVRYWYRCCTDPGTKSGTDVHTGSGGTDIDIVPNLPKCPVPVLMSYRTYRSVRYR